MTASAGICVVSCQPEVETMPPRVSTRDDHAVAEGAEHVVEEVDVGERGGAEDHALGAGAQRVADRGAASAGRRRTGPGTWSSAVICSRWSSDFGEPGAGAVEVDDVQEARAGLDPRARGLQRRVLVDGRLVEVALDQAHGLALGDVDRRVEDHAAAPPLAYRARRSSRSSASPSRRGLLGVELACRRRCPRPTTRRERARRTRRCRARCSRRGVPGTKECTW